MRVVSRVLAGVSALLLLAELGGCGSGSEAPKPAAPKSSPVSQGPFKLVAVSSALPLELKKVGLHNDLPSEPGGVRVWLETSDKSFINAVDPQTRPIYELVGKAGAVQRLQALPDASDDIRDDRQFLVVEIPPGYGPEYAGASLRVTRKGEKMAEWNLNELPEPTKAIADKEPEVTQGKVLGYDVRLAGESALVKRITPFDDGSMAVLSVDLAVNAGPKANSAKDPVEIESSFPRSTWCRNVFSELSIWPPPSGGVRPLEYECRYPESMNRAEIDVKARRFRTLREPITFRNVTIVPEKESSFGRSYRVKVSRDQTVRTPSGLTITLPAGEENGIHIGMGLHLRLRCEQGYKDLQLPASTLSKSTAKPVSLSFGGWVDGRLSVMEENNPKLGENWTGTIPLQGKPSTRPWVLRQLKLVVEQKAVLKEEELRLLVPVKMDVAVK